MPHVVSNTGQPVGSVMPYFGGTIQPGWLLCDGSALSQATYASLYAIIGGACGTAGSNFNIPDLRGRFLRGVDGGTGRDPDAGSRTAMNAGGNTGNNVGSLQADQMQGHFHGASSSASSSGQLQNSNFDFGSGYSGSGLTPIKYNPGITLPVSVSTSVSTSVSAAATDGTNGTPRVGLETRPLNGYANYIIKVY